MGASEPRQPLQPGDTAPDFTLPTVPNEGHVSLSDFRGRTSVLLGFFRGVYCPFCRRNMALLGITCRKLQTRGVEALGVIGSSLERARLYFRLSPIGLPLAADPEVVAHQAYGVPKPPRTPERLRAFASVRINPTGELPEPLPPFDASDALDRLDGFHPTEIDRADKQRVNPQRVGLFLVDRAGIVRWTWIEGAQDDVAGIGRFPSDAEILTAAREVGA